jgi:micrococcal nuclease
VPPAPAPTAAPAADCHPSYPDVCIPPAPPDLDCPEIPYRQFTVVGADPHGFDGDRDGIGCESG